MINRQTAWIIPLILVGLVAGAALNMFTPILAVPILIGVALAGLGLWFLKGSKTEANSMSDDPVEFSDRDKETLV